MQIYSVINFSLVLASLQSSFPLQFGQGFGFGLHSSPSEKNDRLGKHWLGQSYIKNILSSFPSSDHRFLNVGFRMLRQVRHRIFSGAWVVSHNSSFLLSVSIHFRIISSLFKYLSPVWNIILHSRAIFDIASTIFCVGGLPSISGGSFIGSEWIRSISRQRSMVWRS